MGISAKPIGKVKRMFIQIDNAAIKEREKALKSTKKGKPND